LRLGADSRTPTGMTDANPWAEEALIDTVASPTSLTLQAAPSGSYSGVGYYISDPVDLDESLVTALLRLIERELAIAKGMRNVGEVVQLAEMALRDAKAADQRNSQMREAYGSPSPYTRLANWPLDLDAD